MQEHTLCIIKPDAISRNISGHIISMLEEHEFKILAFKMIKLTPADAKAFYFVHKDKPFYESLSDYMSSTAIIAMLLFKDNAIKDLRTLMGATNPRDALEGTIRKRYGISLEQNSIHGSDSSESANIEIPFFFSRYEISHLLLAPESSLNALIKT
ncbi:MAG: nucleoside-diphosphate kinase [Candidatus Fischerbacteria bacterium RBG_13_37_8]|uniref:Nucleoside-diphosphate kinase n=1 Tax=Candidatus Fischerbacteria bacterium RBG_13_37_8 TaxID=1817863 RepID=A0A1F5VV82_9BACT|nr:MAG: nucleoside-diphosphate kinase [Candidatus Fischerbacteria bacterium RBG_13_37_8]